jgi:hypothetical protein
LLGRVIDELRLDVAAAPRHFRCWARRSPAPADPGSPTRRRAAALPGDRAPPFRSLSHPIISGTCTETQGARRW